MNQKCLDLIIEEMSTNKTSIPLNREIEATSLIAFNKEVEISVLIDLEKEIENSLNHSNEEQSDISNGLIYESEVIEAIKKANLTGNITKSAGTNSSIPDADINIDGKIFNIEVKLNKNAQMGGSSIRYSSNNIEFVKPLGPEVEKLLLEAVKGIMPKLEKLLRFIENNNTYNKKLITGFPLSCPKKVWETAQKKGLLVNEKIVYNADFISNFYAKKNTFYIQIGGQGLFYMAANPANLPIPKLEGDIDIEVRTGRSGSKILTNGLAVVGVGIRAQGRLKTKGKSPYTADDPKSLLEMLKVREKLGFKI